MKKYKLSTWLIEPLNSSEGGKLENLRVSPTSLSIHQKHGVDPEEMRH
jgi:hypothetical protein